MESNLTHLILTENFREAKHYIDTVLRDIQDSRPRIVSHIHQIEGLRGPFILHFMKSWDALPHSDRIQIINQINRDTILRSGKVEWDIDANLPLYTRDYLKESLRSSGWTSGTTHSDR